MAKGEPFLSVLSALLQVLFEKLTNPELLQVAGELGVLSTFKKWEKTLKRTEAVLIDAEEKQLIDEDVKVWLDKLKDLVYDMEDILDEIATEALRRNLITEHLHSSSKVRKLIPSVFNGLSPAAVRINVSMRTKIKETTSCLEAHCEMITDLNLEKISGSTSTAEYRRPFSTSLPTEPAIYGRDEDKAKILDMVFGDEPTDANFSVIPIVGMGGIGKTTLARVVFNDKSVLEDFNIRAWVRVSEDFDVLRISKAFLTSITSRPCDMKDLDQVQLQLKESLAGRKFFFVLDDNWNVNYDLWENLSIPFMEGAPGSKIIVTTRSIAVARTMGTGKYYDLKLLSDEDCWLIFAEHAFPNANLKEIHDKVVQKCMGLPLAAKTLGGLLHSIQREDEWLDILNSEIWNNRDKDYVLTGLTLSYSYLPSHLKRCFTYCAMLPTDYEFKEKELVLLWMAEGLIQQSNDNMQLEDLGSEYFRDLVSRSIFQKSDSDDSKFGMHDLIHDLAQRFSGRTSHSLTDKLEGNRQSYRLEKVRYCSYSCGYYDAENTFQVISKLRNLRTFLLLLMDDHTGYVADTNLSDLLTRLKKLRVLSLRNYHITVVPVSIGNLTSLRYLNFSGTEIRSLPESINMLFNLQVLILRDCVCLLKLPSEMRNLINLRHLDIRGANLIREMPLGIKNWKSLQTLSDFIVGKDVGSSITDLKNLKFLNGELCISSLENVIDSPEEVVLCDKKGLEVLILEWGSLFDNSRNEAAENEVLDKLQPHQNLKVLTIKCYGGIRFPSWLGDPSFSNMVVLTLENCEKCTSLPSVGLLGSLKELVIRGMKELKSIGSEIYGEGCSKPFQSLENLSFEDLDECEQWDHNGEEEQVEVFSHLRKLSIIRCPKLTGPLPDHLPSLQELVIHDCTQLMVSFSSLPMVYTLEVDRCRATVCRGPADPMSLNSVILSDVRWFRNWYKQVFQKVECLQIFNCEELIYFWQNEILLQKPPKGLHSLITLRELCIENSPNVKAIPEVDFLSVLSILRIENCNALMFLPERLQHKNARLQHLRIGGCHSLTFIFKSQLPSSLKRLEVKNCGKLQYLFDDGEATPASPLSSSATMHSESINNTSLSFLEHLYVSQCPSLTCLSSRVELLAVLKHLEISGCPKLMTLSSSGQYSNTLRFQGLEVLILEWGSLFDNSRNEAAENEVLDMFQPHQNLKEVTIKCYGGICFPSWLGDPSFSNMMVLTLENCEKCTSLPSLGLLGSLKELVIRGMKGLKSIGSEIYGEGCAKPFQSLENLSFEDLDECELWDPTGEAEHVEVFSRLRKLSIQRCPKLTANLPDYLPSLQELVVHECAQLIVSFSNLPMPYISEIDRCRAIMCRGPVDYESLNSNRSNISRIINWFQQVFQKVECFLFVNCEELIYVWQNESFLEKPPQGLHSIITLRELCIENCPNLTAIPEIDFLSVLSILMIENCNALMSLPVGLQHEKACLQHLRIGGCHSLAFIFKNQLPSSLKRLEVKNCGKLQYLFGDGEATPSIPLLDNKATRASPLSSSPTTLLEHLYVSQCPSLTCLSSRVELLAVIKHLEISGCPMLVTLSSSGQLPGTLQHLNVVDCPKLVSIAKSFHSNMSLEYIKIWRCKKLKLMPGNLTSLTCLRNIYIWDCPSLVSFPEGGLPDTNLRLFSIDKCRQLRSLPQHMHRLNSLRELELRQCPSITSIEEEGLPTSLTSLSIADISFYRPLIEWGLHKLTSLKNLEIRGCVYTESFPEEETGMALPTSLTGLTIARSPNLKFLSSAGLQKLSSLEYLSISYCPALTSFPEAGLPSSLVQLYIYDCPLLKKRCKKDRGEEWFKISHIPRIQMDGRFIEDRK